MIAAVILAAGRSTRLGQPKQLLPYGDRPLLQWALDAVAGSRVDITVVVLGHDAQVIRRAIRWGKATPVVNERYAEGLSTSLACGLAALDARVRGAVIVLADQPLLRPALIDALVDRHRETGAPLVASDYGDHLGAPMLLHTSVWPRAREIHGDEGARALLRVYGDAVVTVPVPAAVAADVDTWEDYTRLSNAQGK